MLKLIDLRKVGKT